MKHLTPILALLLVLSMLLCACGPAGTGGPDDTTAPPDEPIGLGAKVTVVCPEADDIPALRVSEALTNCGADITRYTYSEFLTGSPDLSGADLVIWSSTSGYSVKAAEKIDAYAAGGGPVLLLGSPLSAPSVRVSGTWCTPAELLASGDVIEDFEDGTFLDRATHFATKIVESYPTTCEIEEAGSGFGKSMHFSVSMLRNQDYMTFDADLSGSNALAFRARTGIQIFYFDMMLTDKDGNVWHRIVSAGETENPWHDCTADLWRDYVLPAESFARADGTEGTLNFDDVVSVQIGYDKALGDIGQLTSLDFRIDRLVAVTLEEPYEVIKGETPVLSGLFLSDAYYYYRTVDAFPLAGTDGAAAPAQNGGTLFALERSYHGETSPLVGRICPILSENGNADNLAAWLECRENGQSGAFFGISDPSFYEGDGLSLVTDTALLLIAGDYLCSVPATLVRYTGSPEIAFDVVCRADDPQGMSLHVSVIGCSDTPIETAVPLADLTAGNGLFTVPCAVTLPGLDKPGICRITLVGANGEAADAQDVEIEAKAEAKKLVVACVGDSLTAGVGSGEEGNTYADHLMRIAGPLAITAPHFGHGGTTAMQSEYGTGALFRDTGAYAASKELTDADYVFILFANNEAEVWDTCKEVFYEEYTAFCKEYEELDCHPKIIVGLPALRHSKPPIIDITFREVKPMLEQIAADNGWDVVVLEDCIGARDDLMDESIHPNANGYDRFAHAIYKKLVELECGD